MNILQPTSLVVKAGEAVSGESDLSNAVIRAFHVERAPEPLALRFQARPKDVDKGTPIAWQPVGGDMALGMFIDAPGYYPAPDWCQTLQKVRMSLEDARGNAYKPETDFTVWLVCEVRR